MTFEPQSERQSVTKQRKRQRRRSQHDEPPQSEDAIPKNAIWFSDAFEAVVEAIDADPSAAQFDEHWSEVLQKSRDFEKTVGHDPEEFDDELEEYWHRRKQANLRLRLAIEAKKLIACTIDPRTGEILQLYPKGWVPDEWDDYLPAGIWNQHGAPDDIESPAPEGTLICGAYRPIFFLRAEFLAWLSSQFGSNDSYESKGSSQEAVKKGKLEATVEAIRALWSDGRPAVKLERRHQMINQWLEEHGCDPVSIGTVRNAFVALRR